MKLHELQVAAGRAGSQAQGQSRAFGPGRIAGRRKQRAQAPGRQHDVGRLDDFRAAIVMPQAHAGHRAAAQQQAIHVDAMPPTDMLSPLRLGHKCFHQHATAGIATGMHHAGNPVPALAGQMQRLPFLIESHALALQPAQGARCLLDQELNRRKVVVEGAGLQSVVGVGGRRVVRTDGNGDTALRQYAGAVEPGRRPAQQAHRSRRRCQRHGQPGNAAADDDQRARGCVQTRSCRPTASMRSSALRARAATPAGTVTS